MVNLIYRWNWRLMGNWVKIQRRHGCYVNGRLGSPARKHLGLMNVGVPSFLLGQSSSVSHEDQFIEAGVWVSCCSFPCLLPQFQIPCEGRWCPMLHGRTSQCKDWTSIPFKCISLILVTSLYLPPTENGCSWIWSYVSVFLLWSSLLEQSQGTPQRDQLHQRRKSSPVSAAQLIH